jgi:hypothetical protein
MAQERVTSNSDLPTAGAPGLRLRALAAGAVSLASALACSGQDATDVEPVADAPSGSTTPPPQPLTPEQPPVDTPEARLYVGATRVFGPDTSNGYLFAVPTLDATSTVDLSRAVELEDAWVFGPGGADFYTATLFEPTIKAWHVTPEGTFVEGPTVSFVNAGVGGTYTAASTPWFSDDKAYFVDATSLQVVVWNPRAMEFIRTIELPAEPIVGLEPRAELAITRDRVLVSVFWSSADSTRNGDYVRLISIDPATDTISDVIDDARCASFSPAGASTDGTTYYSPWDFHVATRSVFGPGYGSASCGLRVLPAQAALDEAYELDLSTLVGGRPAAGLQLLGDRDALLHVWHEELVQATPETWSDRRFAAGYTWYRWQIGSLTATELPDQAPSAEGSAWRVIDGKPISFANDSEYTETTLLELDETDHLRPCLKVPGWIVTMLRAY